MPAAGSRSGSGFVGSLVALGVMAAGVIGGVIYLVRANRASQSQAVAQAEAELEAEKAEARRQAAARLKEELAREAAARQTQEEAAALEEENARLRSELAAAQGVREPATDEAAGTPQEEARRIQQSLLRAMEELNRQVTGAEEEPPPPAGRAASGVAFDIRPFGGPSVSLVGGNLQVAGKVGNFGTVPYSFELVVELLRDGYPEETQTLRLHLEPKETAPYLVDFGFRGEHEFTAKVRAR